MIKLIIESYNFRLFICYIIMTKRIGDYDLGSILGEGAFGML